MTVYLVCKEAGRDQDGNIFYKPFRVFGDYASAIHFLNREKQANKFMQYEIQHFDVVTYSAQELKQ